MKRQPLPQGWSEDRVADVAEYYSNQTEAEALAEFEEARSRGETTLLEVPAELVAAVQSLIEDYEHIRWAVARP